MRTKIGTVCMIGGAVLVLAALSLFLWNHWESEAAGRAAGEALIQVKEQIEERIEAHSASQASAGPRGDGEIGEISEIYPDLQDPEMTESEIDGYAYVGYLSIPVVGLEMPVMSECDRPRLKISPCRYAGSTRTDDLVICAHNYARFFGPIRKLTVGDMVYFIDMDGLMWQYEVAEIEFMGPTEIERMITSDYDLTLFTCTYDRKNRVAVRCERVE